MTKIRIKYIQCLEMTTGFSADDVFMMIQLDGGPPERFPLTSTLQMKPDADEHGNGDTSKVDFDAGDDPSPTYYFDKIAYVSVWDDDGPLDFLNEADFLGGFYLLPDQAPEDPDDYLRCYAYGNEGAEYKFGVYLTYEDAPKTEDGEAPDDLMSAAAQSIVDFTNSADGQELLKLTDPTDLMNSLRSALDSSAFRTLVSTAQEYDPVKAVSLGALGQVELFVGVQGLFGVATDIEGFPDDWALFCGGGTDEGIDGDLDGSLALGLWFQSTEEIGGYYVGAEVEVDDIVGAEAVAYAGAADKDGFMGGNPVELDYAKVIFLGVDLGLGGGVEGVETYFVAGSFGGNDNDPCFQTGDYDNMVVLTQIKCEEKSSFIGTDEVRLRWFVDGETDQEYQFPIWNTLEMDDDDKDKFVCGAVVKCNETFNVRFSVDGSVIETQEYKISNFTKDNDYTVTHALKGDGAKYELTAQLLTPS
jgi:hypothetical protein